MKISAFTLVHNAIEGGYPICEAVHSLWPYVDEIVAVDIESTDPTPDILRLLGCRIIKGQFCGNDTCPENFRLHTQCKGDIIILFEADEVWDEILIKSVNWVLGHKLQSLAMYRIQITQNFQRIKEYPIPVHRVFPKGEGSYHLHPTKVPDGIRILPSDMGLIWDCSNCFRDNFFNRKINQIKFFGQDRPIYVPGHFMESTTFNDPVALLNDPYWTWNTTPLKIPDILKPWVGRTKYEVGRLLSAIEKS